jgi:hypothetical protein
LTLEGAAVAATDTDSFMLLESPFRMASAEDLNTIITSLRKIRARAIAGVNSTSYIFSDPIVKDNDGDLKLINGVNLPDSGQLLAEERCSHAV